MFKNVFTVIVCLIIILSSFTPLDVRKYRLKTIVIDAGHGGKDPGCIGKISKESTIALQTALELGKIISQKHSDIKVVYTRSTDVFVELHDRANLANKVNADVFISLHCNSGPPSVCGTETYTMGLSSSEQNLEVAKRENAVILQESDYINKYNGYDPENPATHILLANYQQAHIANSLLLAEKIEKQFETRVKRNSRGVRQAGLLVLWKTAMPSVLVELGFLTHTQEEKFLNSAQNRIYMASAIYRALKEYKEELENMN
ncbi:MAG: N-acetylmuramoyl-L-alanine amidase [Cytophagaceae bacterium]|nr:N-acetylmuramoyl-L-alanine amidase [Cytophagaceae bacterium]MDW8455377.1 N-acetylmuramoyl-L-alanine amidase [Cytophagaceae bacterium]